MKNNKASITAGSRKQVDLNDVVFYRVQVLYFIPRLKVSRHKAMYLDQVTHPKEVFRPSHSAILPSIPRQLYLMPAMSLPYSSVILWCPSGVSGNEPTRLDPAYDTPLLLHHDGIE